MGAFLKEGESLVCWGQENQRGPEWQSVRKEGHEQALEKVARGRLADFILAAVGRCWESLVSTVTI